MPKNYVATYGVFYKHVHQERGCVGVSLNMTTWRFVHTAKRSATLAALVLVWGCNLPVPVQPTDQLTKADLEHAVHHEFDGRYVGTGNVAPGASCRQLVGNWGAMMTVSGSTFMLTPFFDSGQNPLYYGNVSPGGVLTNRKNVFVGSITDRGFVGEYQLSASCRGRYVMERQTTG